MMYNFEQISDFIFEKIKKVINLITNEIFLNSLMKIIFNIF